MDTAVHCLQSQFIIFGKNEIRVSSCPTGQVCFSGREFLLKNNFQNAFAKRIGNNTNFSLSKKSAFIADFFDRLKGLCVLQSPFFNKINPLGICETALWAVKCLRTFIKKENRRPSQSSRAAAPGFPAGHGRRWFSLNGWPSWYAMKSGDCRTSSSVFSRMLESE